MKIITSIERNSLLISGPSRSQKLVVRAALSAALVYSPLETALDLGDQIQYFGGPLVTHKHNAVSVNMLIATALLCDALNDYFYLAFQILFAPKTLVIYKV